MKGKEMKKVFLIMIAIILGGFLCFIFFKSNQVITPENQVITPEKGIIHWKNERIAGHGEPIDYDLAISWIRRDNRVYPDITHWVVEVEGER